ncbi:MAG: hypothetical protein MPJ50_04535 [Pirellulales bacterium]|nr:hypothetical protein [Pirellulales bacterium]
MEPDLKSRIKETAFAFRGYNITNSGRSAELLAAPTYRETMERLLGEANAICEDSLGRECDLLGQVRQARPTTLDTFAEDIAIILAVEIAQITIAREQFEIDFASAPLTFGYSLGEIAALVCAGVYQLADVLPPLLELAPGCAELGQDVTMGIIFSRGHELDLIKVEQICQQINWEGRGVIGISAHLSPNTILVLGQADTIEQLADHMEEEFPKTVHLRKNDSRWPPMHTPILWQVNLPAQAQHRMLTIRGGMTAPQPPVFSLATGGEDYTETNSREIIARWLDRPQKLWDAVYATLAAGHEILVHVGPQPNLVPATFRRLSDNVEAQLKGRSWNSLGLRAMSTIWRPWVSRWISKRSALLRAPYLIHVNLEDWLLDHQPQ